MAQQDVYCPESLKQAAQCMNEIVPLDPYSRNPVNLSGHPNPCVANTVNGDEHKEEQHGKSLDASKSQNSTPSHPGHRI